MTSKALNPFEAHNRLLKAVALADCLDGAGLNADDAVLMDPEEWEMLATAAEVKPPSPNTCCLVAVLLCRRQFARKTFAGKVRQFPAPASAA